MKEFQGKLRPKRRQTRTLRKEVPLKLTVLANSTFRLTPGQTLNLSLKDHLSQFLLPIYHVHLSTKKLQGTLKGKTYAHL